MSMVVYSTTFQRRCWSPFETNLRSEVWWKYTHWEKEFPPRDVCALQQWYTRIPSKNSGGNSGYFLSRSIWSKRGLCTPSSIKALKTTAKKPATTKCNQQNETQCTKWKAWEINYFIKRLLVENMILKCIRHHGYKKNILADSVLNSITLYYLLAIFKAVQSSQLPVVCLEK